MTRTLSNLADDLESLALQLPQRVGIVSPRIALAILQDLVAVTPVDKGIAVSNWQVSLVGPITTPIEAYVPGTKGSTAAANRAAAYAVGAAILADWKADQTIYIGNAAPHIRRLNEGSSTQAPAGFIERAIMLGELAGQGETLTV